MVNTMTEQYQMVRDSRKILFDYCGDLQNDHFVREHPSFGRGGSIRNLTVHIANTYQFWIGRHALAQEIEFTPYQSITEPSTLSGLFETIDIMMDTFFTRCQKTNAFTIKLSDKTEVITTLKLFTHVVTHEFHHKGQILSLSRQWGYTPVDTDIIR